MKTVTAVLMTAVLVSLGWYGSLTHLRKLDQLWITNALAEPTIEMLDNILSSLNRKDYETAKGELQGLRKDWRQVELHGAESGGINLTFVDFDSSQKVQPH